MTQPIILSAPLTLSDWVIKKDSPPFSPEGIRQVLEHSHAYGFTRIYWRCYDCGRSTYASQLIDPYWFNEIEPENMYTDETINGPFYLNEDQKSKLAAANFHNLDSLKYAIDYGHQLGLEIHAWASINEDDHGGGWPSRFSKQHPQYHWVTRGGRVYRSQLSFAFEKVREYKLALIKELLAYDIDGLFLDWIRTGDIRDNPQADDEGVADFGYEEPNIQAFRKQYGLDPHCVPNEDPRWIKLRAEPTTQFMRQCKQLVSANTKRIPLAVMGHNNWGYRGVLPGMDAYEQNKGMGGNKVNGSLRGLLCDLSTWANEGLIDEAVLAGYYWQGGSSTLAHQELVQETGGQVIPWTYEWVPNKVSDMEKCLNIAENVGANQILFWEADYIDNIPEHDLKEIIREIQERRQTGQIR
jgi:hypothetical protein